MKKILAICVITGLMFQVGGCNLWRKKTTVVVAPPPVVDNPGQMTYMGPGTGPVVTFEPAPAPATSATGSGGVTYAPPASAGAVMAPAPGPIVAEPSIHVVQRGDTLWSIAQRYYGRGARWREIAAANGITNSKKLSIGQRLSIP